MKRFEMVSKAGADSWNCKTDLIMSLQYDNNKATTKR